MASEATLGAQKREGTGKGVARKLRQAGRVPGVIYGRELESLHISVDAKEAEHLFHAISVENTIVDVKVEGVKEPFETLVREIQTHPWKSNLVHIDFLRIQAGVAVDVDVPIDLIGVPVGVKLEAGVLEQIIHELPVRCIPSKIPETIEIDVSQLALNDSLHVSDITLDPEVEVRIPGDRTVCSVAPPMAEEVAAVAEEPVEGVEGAGEGAEGAEGREGSPEDDD